MIFEGPIVTAAAAFASSSGILNVWIIFILSLLGNAIPDTILYFFGRFSRRRGIEKFLERFGVSRLRIKKLEKGLEKHSGKSLVLIKLTPVLPVPGLILAGFARISMRRFFYVTILFNLISTVLFTAIGYYSGLALTTLARYLKIESYILIIVIPIALIFYLVYKKIFASVRRTVEKR